MTYATTPRESVRAAFAAVLQDANLDVTIHDRLPYEGADPRSIVLTIISGTSKSPGIGLRKSMDKRAFEEHYRLQLDCYHDRYEVGKLADKVEQALVDAIDTLERGHDIHNLRKSVDSDRASTSSREGRVLMEFTFYTYRELTA